MASVRLHKELALSAPRFPLWESGGLTHHVDSRDDRGGALGRASFPAPRRLCFADTVLTRLRNAESALWGAA